jgi:sulfite reductase alpha subunit-like flavoprotein
VSTGAGFAPYLGMVQEKEFHVTKGSNPYGEIDIFFGCRNSDEDYIYKKDIRRLQGSNIIKATHEAFSRQDVIMTSSSRTTKFISSKYSSRRKTWSWMC